MAESRFLLAGLGNPGREYHLSRHNIGFLFVDYLAKQRGWQVDASKMQGRYCQGRYLGAQLFLLQPQTFMNRSGECVRSFLDYYKIPLEHLLVLHDDIDLPAGRIKLVSKGGAGGHNGIRSIIQHVGTQDFSRMKIGVGRPVLDSDGNGQSVEHFVLSRMSQEELSLFVQRQELVDEAITLFVHDGVQVAMNKINGRAS